MYERNPPTSNVTNSARCRAAGSESSANAAKPSPQQAARVGPRAAATPAAEIPDKEDKVATSPTVPGRVPVLLADKPKA